MLNNANACAIVDHAYQELACPRIPHSKGARARTAHDNVGAIRDGLQLHNIGEGHAIVPARQRTHARGSGGSGVR